MVGADNDDIPLISDAYNATIANTGDLNIKNVSQMNALFVNENAVQTITTIDLVHVLINKSNVDLKLYNNYNN